jgi:hypothetical protein
MIAVIFPSRVLPFFESYFVKKVTKYANVPSREGELRKGGETRQSRTGFLSDGHRLI